MEGNKASHVVAVFVIQFDVHKGNMIEWQYPTDINLEGIEYQAICSGLHRIESDTIYFTRDNYTGISVFQNKSMDVERGAYMKAIGVLVQKDAWKHKEFLRKELSHHMTDTPVKNYDGLLDYYTQYATPDTPVLAQKKTLLSTFDIWQGVNHQLEQKQKTQVIDLLDQNSVFGTDSFSEFVRLFGPNIFVLWKAALLQKRILFMGAPPMEKACKFAYDTFLLGQVPVQLKPRTETMLKYTVGVNEIPDIEGLSSYIGCTPDSIFELKKELYDMSIRFQPNAKPIIYSMQPKYTPADFIRFQYLYKLLDDIIPWQEYVANEPKDLSSQASKLMTGFYFWLYSNDENREEEEQRRNKPPFSWQKLFAGSNRSRQSNPFASSSYSEESQALLIEEADEQDATEINNNQVFEAVAARASTEAAMNNGDITDKNKALIRFFHSLSFYVLSTLQALISLYEVAEEEVVILKPKDMVLLGLDPHNDVDFVTELGRLYFEKHIIIAGMYDTKACVACCTPKKKSGHIQL